MIDMVMVSGVSYIIGWAVGYLTHWCMVSK
jgi:hypothetical protein